MPSAETTLTPGKQITKGVSLVSPLSSGGMGAVWLADHQGLKTRVVVKFMLDDLNASSSARTRFSREAAAAAHVKSPHVVQMLDHGVTDDGVPFIVMEHLEGHDLGDELEAHQGRPLDPAKVVTIVAQVSKALTKVHAAGLLHRDIKPDNIFLVKDEDEGEGSVFVKLLDFGIAKSAPQDGVEPATMDSETKTGQIVGTPFYMSPEQVTASKVIDLRSDLWALGVVAYEALTGKRPYDGPSFGALAVKIATGTAPKPTEANPALPVSVDAWFAKACAREAADRFGSAKELSDALRGAFDGVVSLAPPISGDSGARTVPRPSAQTLGLAKTALDDSGPATKSSPDNALARSEAGVSVSATKTQRSSLVLLGGLVVVALVGILFIFTKKAPETPAVTAASAPPKPESSPSVAPEPKVTAVVSAVAPPAVDAGAAPNTNTTAPATTAHVPAPPKPTATTTKPVESPAPKPTATPKPSAEPDPLY